MVYLIMCFFGSVSVFNRIVSQFFQTKDGQILEAPRRLIIECPHWAARHFLAMRILHSWAKEPPWPARGVPVAISLYLPLIELNSKKTISNFIEKVRRSSEIEYMKFFVR